jgi:hypothetical protein
MTYSIPVQDQRYADPGRREVTVAGRRVGAACTPLTPEDAVRHRATHQIVCPAVRAAKPGIVVEFEGVPYRVAAVTDPRAGDPAMRGRYMRLVCSPEPPTPDPTGEP